MCVCERERKREGDLTSRKSSASTVQRTRSVSIATSRPYLPWRCRHQGPGTNPGTGTAYHPTALSTLGPYALPVPGSVPDPGPCTAPGPTARPRPARTCHIRTYTATQIRAREGWSPRMLQLIYEWRRRQALPASIAGSRCRVDGRGADTLARASAGETKNTGKIWEGGRCRVEAGGFGG